VLRGQALAGISGKKVQKLSAHGGGGPAPGRQPPSGHRRAAAGARGSQPSAA